MAAAQDKRYEAIRVVSGALLEAIEAQSFEPGAAAEAIAPLAKLGRTERWQHAVQQWAALIIETPENYRWAVIQGSIWTAFKA